MPIRRRGGGPTFRTNPEVQRVGPLRKITRVIVRSGSPFQQGTVELECGHRVKTNNQLGQRARCGDPICVVPWDAARKKTKEPA